MRSFLRAENEGLTVGSVQINVLEVRHDSVLLGIHDPQATPCYREEVLHLPSGDDGSEFDEVESDFEAVPFETIRSCAIPML